MPCAALVPGCSSAATGEDVGSAGAAVTANDQTAYDFFVGKGLTNFQAAGIVGNLDQESNMDPTVSQYGGGPGRGIAQWSAGGRWDTDGGDNAVWYAGTQGESVWSLQLQLEFIWYELTTFSGYGLSELRGSTNLTDATVAFETYYEGCGTCDQSNRIAYAQAALSAFGSQPPPAPPSYGATFVSQSFPLASTAMTMFAGQTIAASLDLKNSGAKAWDSSTHLGTTQPRDRTSKFADGSWLSPSRPAGVSGTVAPGATYTFKWNFHAPSTPGTYLEYFNVVQEGVAWFSDPGQGGPADNDLEANIVVVPGVRGSLDSAACDAIAGWAQDQASPGTGIFTDLYFDAPVGQAGAGSIRVTASTSRADLCTAIGSCAHGFSVPVPAGLMDGAAHQVYAYGIANAGEGPNELLGGSPKSFTCAPPAPPFTPQSGIKRHVPDPAAFSAWKFDSLDVAKETAAEIAAYPTGAPLPEAPKVVIATGDPAVWVIDGAVRRHVVSPASLASWSFTVATVSATEIDGYPQGADWPTTEFLVEGTGDPAVYVLDVAPTTAPTDAGAFDAGVTVDAGDAGAPANGVDGGTRGEVLDSGIPGAPASEDGGHRDARANPSGDPATSVTGSSGGCAVSPRRSDSRDAMGFFLVLGLAGLVARRRPGARRIGSA